MGGIAGILIGKRVRNEVVSAVLEVFQNFLSALGGTVKGMEGECWYLTGKWVYHEVVSAGLLLCSKNPVATEIPTEFVQVSRE
jgi:hypothetical protein